jgi:hypothetical protein
MISITKYLFYIFLISHYFDVQKNVATAKTTTKSQQEESTLSAILKTNISEAKEKTTLTSKGPTKISTPT